MVRLSGVGKDKIRNLIKAVTFPLPPHPGWDEHPVLLRCSFFMSLSVTFSHMHPGYKHAFEGFLPSGLQEGASCEGQEKW